VGFYKLVTFTRRMIYYPFYVGGYLYNNLNEFNSIR
jgi:hypothetical protein